MQKKFIQNLMLLMIANIIIKPFWIFGIDRYVQNEVHEASYGLYFAVYNFTFIFQILLDLGINQFNNREISQSPTRIRQYFNSLFSFKILLVLFYFLVTAGIALASGSSPEKTKLLLIMCANMSLTSIILYFRSNIAGLQFFKTDAFFSVFDRLLAIIICMVMIAGVFPWFRVNIYHFALAQTVALLVSAITAFCVIVFNISKLSFVVDVALIKSLVKKALPFTLLSVLMVLHNRSDVVLIERLLKNGKEEAGIYGAAYRLYDAFMQFAYLFSVLLLPLFARMISKKQNVAKLLGGSASLLMSGVVLIGICCACYSQPIMHALYHNANEYWCTVFELVMLSFIPAASVFVFGSALTANGNLKQLNWIAFSCLVLNVSMNVFLIPALKAKGGAISSVFTQYASGSLHFLLAIRVFGLRVSWLAAGKWLLFTISVGAAYFVMDYLHLNWLVSLPLVIGCGLLLSFLLKLIDVKSLAVLFTARAQ